MKSKLKMGFAVAIIGSQNPRAVVVRKKWIYQFNETLTMNNGMRKNKKHIVFYSNNINAEADFSLPLKQTLDESSDACYHAKLYRFFGKSNKFYFISHVEEAVCEMTRSIDSDSIFS